MSRRRALVVLWSCLTASVTLVMLSETAWGMSRSTPSPRSNSSFIATTTRCDTPWGMTIEPMFDAEGGHWAVRISGLRDGRAKTVGLLEDDLIIKANDLVVQSTDTVSAPQRLVNWFRAIPCETPVTFVIVRGTTRMELAAPGLKP